MLKAACCGIYSMYILLLSYSCTLCLMAYFTLIIWPCCTYYILVAIFSICYSNKVLDDAIHLVCMFGCCYYCSWASCCHICVGYMLLVCSYALDNYYIACPATIATFFTCYISYILYTWSLSSFHVQVILLIYLMFILILLLTAILCFSFIDKNLLQTFSPWWS